MDYRPRVVDALLDEVFGDLPAIALEGVKGTGKTSTAARRARRVLPLDQDAVRALVQADVRAAIEGDPPVLIDEWQLLPSVWDAVRRAVDSDPSGGRFLLTGSATVPPQTRIHSGAGRIMSLRMRPMTLPERGVGQAQVSLSELARGAATIPTGRSATTGPTGPESALRLSDYVEEIVSSGLPGIRALPDRVRRHQLDSYLTRMVDHEIPDVGGAVRRPAALRAWLAAYAAATSTTASYTTILNAATPNEGDKPARSTAQGYRELLTRLWILDPLPAWVPSFSHLQRLGASAKHHLADPALAAALLRATPATLLGQRGQTLAPGPESTLLGALFESLATLSVRVFADRHGWQTSHLRTRNGDHEIDLIVETDGLKVLALEVKLADTVTDADVAHLHWLKHALGERVTDTAVLTTGAHAYRRSDGVAVIPLGLLGP